MGLLVKSEKLPSNSGHGNEKKKVISTGIQPPKKVQKGTSRDIPGTSHPRSRSNSQDESAYSEFSRPETPAKPKHDAKGALTLKQRIRAARKRGINGNVQDLRFLIEEGPLSFRAFGFIGGFFLLFSSTLDLIEGDDDAGVEPMSRLITFYLWFCGFIAIQLEGRPFHFQIGFIYNAITIFFAFLRFVWGRGFFYFATGCIQFFLFTQYDMVCGVYFMLLGVTSIIYGYRASVRLAELRNNIRNRSDIKFIFHSFDRDRDGFLNAEEFRELLMSLNQDVTYNDFVAAMSAVDADNNQMISIQDLELWWGTYQDGELPPGTLCCTRGSYHRNTNGADAHLMA